MNCPSRTDEPPASDGLNQNPNDLSNDLTTNQDLNGLANTRRLRRSASSALRSAGDADDASAGVNASGVELASTGDPLSAATATETRVAKTVSVAADGGRLSSSLAGFFRQTGQTIWTFFRFMGPGFVVAVAYIDPGNYATDIAAGSSYRYRLLFVVLLSNIFAIFLQSMAVKLGTVTGRNLAQACRAFLPRWLNFALYVLAEVAIIATDIAEVIGTAIALNLLQPRLPLLAGCAISIVDVLVVLVFCRPDSSKGVRRGMRAFELLVVPLVLAVVVCFCIQLSLVQRHAGSHMAVDVLRGYLPSSALVQSKGLYQACGILGATVMPHSLYLGSGIVQPRLRDYDRRMGLMPPADQTDDSDSNSHSDKEQTSTYIPSLAAMRHCLKYSTAELVLALFTFALFVNSAILVVAGTSLYGNDAADGADIFAIHDLLAQSISPAAGTVFALALLFSGLSAGLVCTVAGQMLSEGALHWTVSPWLRRLLTRSISILPSIVIAGAVGRRGLDAALNATQVVLSVALPFLSAPLLWFTCRSTYMTVRARGGARIESTKRGRLAAESSDTGDTGDTGERPVADLENNDVMDTIDMSSSWPVALLGAAIWLVIAAMNVANLVLLGKSD